MAISGVASSGLMSGLDINGLVAQIIELESRPMNLLSLRQNDYELKINSVVSLSAKLSSYKSAIEKLNSSTNFNTKSATVTKTSEGSELLTVSASSEAAKGGHTIKVSQLAAENKKASQGFIDKNTTTIASATGNFIFKVGSSGAETNIAVSSTTTLQELVDGINSSSAPVTASIMHDGSGSNPYRLVLTADDSGSLNSITIMTNDTTLDFTNKKIEDAYAYTDNSYSGTVYANSGNYYTGTDNKSYIAKITTAGSTIGALADRAKYKYSTDGGITWSSEITVSTGGSDATADIVIDSTNKTLYRNGAAVTLSEGTYTGSGLATEMQTQLNAVAAGHTVSYDSATRKFTTTNNTGSEVTFNWSNSAATAAGVLGFDTDDSIVANTETDVADFDTGMFIDDEKLANSTNGRTKFQFGITGTLAVGDKFSIDVFNPEMQEAMDAVITVDNATIVKSSNTITDAIEGVTMNLLDADSSETLNLTVSSDSSTAKEDIGSFVTAYNELYAFIDEQMSYDPEEGKANPLLGDPTLAEIRNKISNAITSTIPGISSSATYRSLSQIGITTNYKTGQLSIDYSKVSSALSNDADAVSKLFVGSATQTNQAITYESKTSDTQAGTYGISISTAPEQATLTGDNDLSSTVLASDEILTFKYSNNYSDTDKTYNAFSVTLSSGSTINSIVATLNSGFATNDAGFTASNSGGMLKIISTDYGADNWFQVTTDQEGAGHIWNDNDADPTLGIRSDVGVDISGSINGHAAIAEGNILTGALETAEAGLKISTTSNQTGLMGAMRISMGIADRLPSILDSYLDSGTGVLSTKEASLKSSVDSMQDRIDTMETRIATKETNLLAEFARLEVLLGRYSSLSQYLTDVMASLPGIVR